MTRSLSHRAVDGAGRILGSARAPVDRASARSFAGRGDAQPAVAAAARTSARTCSVSSAFSSMKAGEVFTE